MRQRSSAKSAGSTDEEVAPARILVVEDDDSMASYVSIVLTNASMEVTHVTSAEGALSTLEQHRWDCVITDIGLPGMSGLELTRHLRSIGSRLPVAVMTAHVEPGTGREVLAAGADAFLAKPFTPTDLRVRLRALLQAAAGGRAPAAGV